MPKLAFPAVKILPFGNTHKSNKLYIKSKDSKFFFFNFFFNPLTLQFIDPITSVEISAFPTSNVTNVTLKKRLF